MMQRRWKITKIPSLRYRADFVTLEKLVVSLANDLDRHYGTILGSSTAKRTSIGNRSRIGTY